MKKAFKSMLSKLRLRRESEAKQKEGGGDNDDLPMSQTESEAKKASAKHNRHASALVHEQTAVTPHHRPKEDLPDIASLSISECTPKAGKITSTPHSLIPECCDTKTQKALEKRNLADNWLGIPQQIAPEDMVCPKVDNLLSNDLSPDNKIGAPLRPKNKLKVRVHCYGPGIDPTGVIVQEPTMFHIKTFNVGKRKVEVYIENPKGQLEPVQIKYNDSKTYTVTYSTKFEGLHKIKVVFSGKEIPRSPFNILVEGHAGDPSKVTAASLGLETTGGNIASEENPSRNFCSLEIARNQHLNKDVISISRHFLKYNITSHIFEFENELWDLEFELDSNKNLDVFLTRKVVSASTSKNLNYQAMQLNDEGNTVHENVYTVNFAPKEKKWIFILTTKEERKNQEIKNHTFFVLNLFTEKLTEGTYYCQQALKYGVNQNLVGGVSPNKAGAVHLGRPVFKTVKQENESNNSINRSSHKLLCTCLIIKFTNFPSSPKMWSSKTFNFNSKKYRFYIHFSCKQQKLKVVLKKEQLEANEIDKLFCLCRIILLNKITDEFLKLIPQRKKSFAHDIYLSSVEISSRNLKVQLFLFFEKYEKEDEGFGPGMGPDRGNFGIGPERSFGRGYGSGPNRGFGSGYDGSSPGGGPSRSGYMGSGDRDFGFGPGTEKPFQGADRGGASGDRSFGNSGNTSYFKSPTVGYGGGTPEGGYASSPADRGFGSSIGRRSFGGYQSETYGADDRGYGMTDKNDMFSSSRAEPDFGGATGGCYNTESCSGGDSYENYPLTPVPSVYNFSDDEGELISNNKPIAFWAQDAHLESAIISNFFHPVNTDHLFGNRIKSPNLNEIFGINKDSYLRRTSSVMWRTPADQ